MKANTIIIFLTLGLALLFCMDCNGDRGQISTILMDQEYLHVTKPRIEKKDQDLMSAFDQLIKDADLAILDGPYSVTHKDKLAPSGDNHDYASYSRYWWPDPKKTDGLPYIRKDGETYPGSQSVKESDRPRIGALGMSCESLGLAYYYTGKQKYAEKAAELIRIWFLDESTLMNPNLNHAQCRPGHNLGSKSGVLDGRLMVSALEASLLITNSAALSNEEYTGLRAWATEYFEWLTTNELALKESVSKNNHGSYYDAQAMYFALYSRNHMAAKRIANNFMANRLISQIKSDGSMPEEMARTRPLFYSIYNLQAIFLVAHLAKKVDVDIWQSNYSDSRLRAALDYLTPYTDSKVKWKGPTIGAADRMELFPILQVADRVYKDGDYKDEMQNLPIRDRMVHRSNLAFPLMR